MSDATKIPAITLLTDFGQKDGFVGVMKGVMLAIKPDLKIVDISHEIAPHDVLEASFVLGQSYAYFPENTLHVVVVDPGVGTERAILYVEAGYYKFLAPDNGALRFVFANEKVYRVIRVENRDYFLPEQSTTFHGRDIFAPVAAHLANGLDPAELGPQLESVPEFSLTQPEISSDFIRGEIIYIDHFGNLITNVHQSLILDILKDRIDFRIVLGDKEIHGITETFASQPPGRLLAYIDSSEYLGFAINGQNAAEKMGISVGDRFEILFGSPRD